MAKKKRYHQTHRDRMHESRGMSKYEHRIKGPQGTDIALHRIGDEFYAGYQGRTVQEHEDYTMLHEDRRAIANMPQQVIMKEYPRYAFTMDENINDDIRGIDVQQRDDGKRQKRGPYPEKY
jgi:hypothetical protein